MPKGENNPQNMSRTESFDTVRELDRIYRSLYISRSAFCITFATPAQNLAYMIKKVHNGGVLRKAFRYRLRKVREDVKQIRPEFVKLASQYGSSQTGLRGDVFQTLYYGTFGIDAPYGRFGKRPELLERCEKVRATFALSKGDFSRALGYNYARYYDLLRDMELGISGLSAFLISERLDDFLLGKIEEARRNKNEKHARKQS